MSIIADLNKFEDGKKKKEVKIIDPIDSLEDSSIDQENVEHDEKDSKHDYWKAINCMNGIWVLIDYDSKRKIYTYSIQKNKSTVLRCNEEFETERKAFNHAEKKSWEFVN